MLFGPDPRVLAKLLDRYVALMESITLQVARSKLVSPDRSVEAIGYLFTCFTASPLESLSVSSTHFVAAPEISSLSPRCAFAILNLSMESGIGLFLQGALFLLFFNRSTYTWIGSTIALVSLSLGGHLSDPNLPQSWAWPHFCSFACTSAKCRICSVPTLLCLEWVPCARSLLLPPSQAPFL